MAFHGRLIAAAMAIVVWWGAAASAAESASVSVVPGTVVRWSVPGTKECGMQGLLWPALNESCYYPIDLEQKPGVVTISRRGPGARERAKIVVEAGSSPRETIDLGDIPQAHPLPADLTRNAREQARLAKIWKRPHTPARFTLPLGAPMRPLPEGNGFGSTWVFGGDPANADLHTGADYGVPIGTPVLAVADGTVAIAEDLFYPGNAVFLDHGDGLVSMYFHLSEISVKPGQELRKGDTVGLSGRTGRVSGAHLHFGVRWRNARIDPHLLLEDPAKIPAVH
jgi:murein DD-endopeptidase MepM/ murein hydrolase activator NlpD